MKQNFVFDLDGTLVDTLPGIAASINLALARSGAQTPHVRVSDVRSYIGPPIGSMLQSLAQPSGEQELARMVSAFRQAYDSTGWQQTREFSGVRKTLDHLRWAGKRIFLVTNKPLHGTLNILNQFEFRRYFDVVLTPDSRTPAFTCKADMLRYLVQRYSLLVEECLMIGDTADDFTAAASAGMEAVCVGYGYGWERLASDHPECRIVPDLRVIRNEFIEPAVGGTGAFL